MAEWIEDHNGKGHRAALVMRDPAHIEPAYYAEDGEAALVLAFDGYAPVEAICESCGQTWFADAPGPVALKIA